MVHSRWTKLIRMVDEQKGCEWMNVSSGTGSIEETRTKGHKTVVCEVPNEQKNQKRLKKWQLKNNEVALQGVVLNT